jgi:hypothetical protein
MIQVVGPSGQCDAGSGNSIRRFYRPHEIKRAPHQPYSSNLAPLKCCLFGYLKERRMTDCADSTSELLVRIEEILTGIERDTLNVIFDE